MKERLLAHLACSECDGRFTASVRKRDEEDILEGTLSCSGCGATFPVTRGVPRFLPKALSAAKQATAEAFGYEWTHYTELTKADKAEFLDWIAPLTENDFADRLVLDGGCGKGRHIFLAAQFGAREVIGIDLSDAVESAYGNTRHLPNVHVVQADILHLPFKNIFDLIYSIGVLHHLPEPKAGFIALAKHLKPGGRSAIWVYGKEGNLWIEKFVDPVRINITSKLPKIVTRVLSFLIAAPLFIALKLIYRPVQSNASLAWMKKRLPYAEYLCAISGYSFAENFWNVFDHLVAPTAFYHSRGEIEDWFATGKFQEVQITQRNNNSWRGTGLRVQT
jgi:SAM-dependent methyltransferase